MVFALFFIAVFLVSVVVYLFTYRWTIAVLVPMIMFVLSVLMDTDAASAKTISLIFGIPIVVFASLLGAYVVQMRSPQVESDEEQSTEVE